MMIDSGWLMALAALVTSVSTLVWSIRRKA